MYHEHEIFCASELLKEIEINYKAYNYKYKQMIYRDAQFYI